VSSPLQYRFHTQTPPAAHVWLALGTGAHTPTVLCSLCCTFVLEPETAADSNDHDGSASRPPYHARTCVRILRRIPVQSLATRRTSLSLTIGYRRPSVSAANDDSVSLAKSRAHRTALSRRNQPLLVQPEIFQGPSGFKPSSVHFLRPFGISLRCC